MIRGNVGMARRSSSWSIVTVPAALGPCALVDPRGFISSFLLAAYAHGVDITSQGPLDRHASFVREYFGIPDTQQR